MKTITNKTALVQGDKTYEPIEVDGVIYWVDNSELKVLDYFYFNIDEVKDIVQVESEFHLNRIKGWIENLKIIAQSSLKLEGIPVISLDDYVEKLYYYTIQKCRGHSFKKFYDLSAKECSKIKNPNQYTLKDIENVIELVSNTILLHKIQHPWARKQQINRIVEQINSISIINVDEQFNIISYE